MPSATGPDEAMGRRLGIVVLAASTAAAGCAGTRIEGGVFTSDKGYRLEMPGEAWTVARDSRADLELRHRDGSAGIVVNASCGAGRSSGPLPALARHLLSGLRDRSVVTREDVSVNGKAARHAIVDGRTGAGGAPVRIELYVMRDERCLYDFLYAAPPERFDATRGDFERVLGTFTTDGR
jgi:hypothetical protein